MLEKQLAQGLEAVENKLQAIVDSEISTLYDASHHIIGSGGKRVRPQVAILSYLASGGTNIQEVVPLAAAVEMVHTATLVHDDINDHSPMRRGKVAVHSHWGRTFALLTGDYLFAKVYELMAPYGGSYNVIMADACVKLVEGETLQAAAAKSGEMDRETYKKIIDWKTAVLFKAAARMGTMLGGGSQEQVEAMAEYGHYLGLTFQIVDDILDIIGDPETMGKPAGLDLQQSRGVMMPQQNNGNGHNSSSEAIISQATEGNTILEMIDQLRDSGAVDIARMQAQETAKRSRQALSSLEPSEATTKLNGLIDLVLERDK